LKSSPDCLETVPEIDRDATGLPTKPESDFIIGCAALLETDGGGNSVRVGDQTLDIAAQIMLRVWIGLDVGLVHHLCHCCRGNKGKRG
jgi:hypothetical protein